MAQNSSFRLQYLGAVSVKKNVEYTASQFATLFPNANTFMLKSNKSVNVSINSTVAFPIEYGELNAFDGTSSFTYVFTDDCIIAICDDLDVA